MFPQAAQLSCNNHLSDIYKLFQANLYEKYVRINWLGNRNESLKFQRSDNPDSSYEHLGEIDIRFEDGF